MLAFDATQVTEYVTAYNAFYILLSPFNFWPIHSFKKNPRVFLIGRFSFMFEHVYIQKESRVYKQVEATHYNLFNLEISKAW